MFQQLGKGWMPLPFEFESSRWRGYGMVRMRGLQDIERKDLLKLFAFLAGIRGLVGKNDWPRYTEEEPEMFEQAELDKLFKACDAEERLWCEFFLMTGMREQEVMHTYWSDVNLSGHGSRSATSATADGHQRRTRSARFLSLQSLQRA